MPCRICHSKKHNFLTCKFNNVIPSQRTGARRKCCKKIQLKSPKFLRLQLFTKKVPDCGREMGSEKLLSDAKKVVVQELDRLQALVVSGHTSGFERAWFEASGETLLWFNFAGMRDNVMNARFGIKDMGDDDFGYNNAVQVVLNKRRNMNETEITKTLLHECMHHNVTKGPNGNSHLNTNVDHLALALLGDQNECASFKLGWLDCVFHSCKNPNCRKIDWEIVYV